MKIYESINNVMSKFSAIYKDGTVGFGNNSYKVVTYDNIIRHMREHLVEQKIIINPMQIEKGVYTDGITAKGGKKYRYDALYDVEFISVEDGSKLVSRVEVSTESFGDDKAPSKATTVAVKNAILKVFSLESADEMQEQVKNKITDKQFTMLKNLVQSADVDLEAFLNYFNADTLADMSQDYYNQAVEQLQKKIKTKGKADGKDTN